MLEKILMGWVQSIGKVCGWYTKRSDLVAGLLYPVLVAFITLWCVITLAVTIGILVFELVRVPFYGINGLGEDEKLLTDMISEQWKEEFGLEEETEEPEEEPEETTEEPVEVYIEDGIDDLDKYLDESEES